MLPIPGLGCKTHNPSVCMITASRCAELDNKRKRVYRSGVMPLSDPTVTSTMTQASPSSSDDESESYEYKRLRVEDAVNYLDQVKSKFGNQSEVYNLFLDTMKDFKSQRIDIPEVITQVSNLFKDHPDFIIGFNTFLPRGYKVGIDKNVQGCALQVSVTIPQRFATAMTEISEPMDTRCFNGYNEQTTTSAFSIAKSATDAVTNDNYLRSKTLVECRGSFHMTENMAKHNPAALTHAIDYVNKIKVRFEDQPFVYDQFLDILTTYQHKLGSTSDDGHTPSVGHRQRIETEVYLQVAKLFNNHDDLLDEFKQFCAAKNQVKGSVNQLLNKQLIKETSDLFESSDQENDITQQELRDHNSSDIAQELKPSVEFVYEDDHDYFSRHAIRNDAATVKRSLGSTNGTTCDLIQPIDHLAQDGPHPPKLIKLAIPPQYALFDIVKDALKSKEAYNNFLRYLVLYKDEIISHSVLMESVTPLLGKFPDIFQLFKEFIGYPNEKMWTNYPNISKQNKQPTMENSVKKDPTMCRRVGTSYCERSSTDKPEKCSGQTELCKSVLNDTCISNPIMFKYSESMLPQRRTYQDHIHQCEDEMSELDYVIESNMSTIVVLERIQKRLECMSSEKAVLFKLNNCLGGSSPTIHQNAVKRLYGDKACDIITGLKETPSVTVPIVLGRLREKAKEWQSAKTLYNKNWREILGKYYLKSLDFQGPAFKINDLKALRSKHLFEEIETLYNQRFENNNTAPEELQTCLTLNYKNKSVLDDATALLIHHVKRQTSMQINDKSRAKKVLRQFIPDLFFHPRQPLSDDEDEDEIPINKDVLLNGDSGVQLQMEDVDDQHLTTMADTKNSFPDDFFTMFITNSSWYLFLRLHATLCERLSVMYKRYQTLVEQEKNSQNLRRKSTAMALNLKPRNTPESVCAYYMTLLDMVKDILDGNISNSAYEDNLREMFGVNAYIAFTLDKVVSLAVRQLHYCVTERTSITCMELFLHEKRHGSSSTSAATSRNKTKSDTYYQKKVEQLLYEESCFKMLFYKTNCRLTIEMVAT